MRNICAAVLSVALITSSAFAASDNSTGTLAPGKPAGVKAAQAGDSTILFVAGGIALAGIIALSMSNNNSGAGANPSGAPTTTSTL